MTARAVGVVLVGHGRTASELLQAATGIVGPDANHGGAPQPEVLLYQSATVQVHLQPPGADQATQRAERGR